MEKNKTQNSLPKSARTTSQRKSENNAVKAYSRVYMYIYSRSNQSLSPTSAYVISEIYLLSYSLSFPPLFFLVLSGLFLALA